VHVLANISLQVFLNDSQQISDDFGLFLTVSRIANKHRLTNDVKDRPRSGRPVLHSEENNALGRLVR
jgi:hypothetical protein